MAENKTTPTEQSVEAFLGAVEPEVRRADGRVLCAMMEEITGESPVMWGDSLVGFGQYHYRYASGREGDFFRIGFSPRKSQLVLYVMPGYDGFEDLLARLGRFKTGKSCLYVTRLEHVDEAVLRELITRGWTKMEELYPTT